MVTAPTIKLVGWQKGLKKVELALAIKDHGLFYSLQDASDLIAYLLNNKPIEVLCKNLTHARIFSEKAVKLGAKLNGEFINIVQGSKR